MPTNTELSQLQAEINARSHAMSTSPLDSAQWRTNAARLNESLTDAQVLIELGRGVASQAAWSSFLATVQRQSHSLSAENRLVIEGEGLRPSERAQVAYQDAPAMPSAGRIRSTPTRTASTLPPTTTAPAPVTTTPTTTAGVVGTAKQAPPPGFVAPTHGGQTSGGQTPGGPAPQQQAGMVPASLMAWLNPSNVPVYRRPWFIGMAVITVAGVTYYSVNKNKDKV